MNFTFPSGFGVLLAVIALILVIVLAVIGKLPILLATLFGLLAVAILCRSYPPDR